MMRDLRYVQGVVLGAILGLYGPIAQAAPASPAAATPATQTPAYLSYIYEGDKYRDPFIPLNGTRGDDTDPAPQISALILKGLMRDEAGRIALLVSGSRSYILRGGRLYDGRNKPVKGIKGVIKTETVVLIGSDRVVREISAEHAQ
jgi:hypothetical protein